MSIPVQMMTAYLSRCECVLVNLYSRSNLQCRSISLSLCASRCYSRAPQSIQLRIEWSHCDHLILTSTLRVIKPVRSLSIFVIFLVWNRISFKLSSRETLKTLYKWSKIVETCERYVGTMPHWCAESVNIISCIDLTWTNSTQFELMREKIRKRFGCKKKQGSSGIWLNNVCKCQNMDHERIQ